MPTDSRRILNLEIAIERLCEMMQRNTRAFPNHWTELELIKQYARGRLDPADAAKLEE